MYKMYDIATTYIRGISIIGFLLLIATLLRAHVKFLQKWHLPSCIIAGIIALILGPELLGKRTSTGSFFSSGIHDAWKTLPGLLINIVFAGLFLGKKIPPLREIWSIAGPQFSFAQVVARGQYVVGIILTLLILGPIFGLPPITGALIEIAFEGGHGTAAGLSHAFEQLGFQEGYDLALGLATIGVIAGIIGGVILVNRGIATGRTSIVRERTHLSLYELKGLFDPTRIKKVIGYATTRPESVEPLSIHIAFIGISIVIGYLLHQGLGLAEGLRIPENFHMVRYIPLFPLAMIGGVLVQIIINKYISYPIIDRETILRICGSAMDVLIVAALANLSLQVIGTHFIPFMILATAGITRNVCCFLYIAPKMMRTYWFEKGISDFGQATGMTAIGLLLIKMSDPENNGPGLTSFGYKQLLFEPFLGGGIITAASVPLIATFGAEYFGIVALILMISFFFFGYYTFGTGKRVGA